MSCTVNSPSFIRKLYFQCTETILDNYEVPTDKRTIIGDYSYLVLSVLPSDYTSLQLGDKTSLVSTFSKPFVTPRLVQTGFTAAITEDLYNVYNCLRFIALSSVSTSYETYIPVTVLDYCKPELEDTAAGFTTRKGLLTIEPTSGTSGNQTAPSFIEGGFRIQFVEINKRLVM